MAFRSVFVNFSSNAGSFANQMTYAAHSMNQLEAAQIRASISGRKVSAVLKQHALDAYRAGHALTDYGAKLALMALREEEIAKQQALARTRLMSGQSAIMGRLAITLGAGLAAGFGAATVAAGRFETRIANISTISENMRLGMETVDTTVGQTKESLEASRESVAKWTDGVGSATSRTIDMREAILDLSTQLPQSAGVLAEALYEIVSSGFDGSQALEVLHASATAATAGLTDAQTAAKGITAVLNAYGRETYKASEVSDILFKTVELGVIRFEEISAQLGDFVGYGATAGVSMEDLGAAISTITLAGIPAAQAATSLNRVLQSLVKPNESLAAVFRDMGYASGVEAVKALGGLNGVMKALQEETGGSVIEIVTLFDEIRAARGALALMTNNMENYNRVNNEFTEKNKIAGATLDALRRQQGSFEYQLKLLRNTIERAGIAIGEKLLPVAKTLIETLKGIFSWFNNLSGTTQSLIIGFISLAAIFTITWGGLFRLTTMVSQYRIATMGAELASKGFGLSLGVMSGLAGIASLAIMGIGAAFMKSAAARNRDNEAIKNKIALMEAEAAGSEGVIRKDTESIVKNKELATVYKELGINLEDVYSAMEGSRDATRELGEAFADVVTKNEAFNNLSDTNQEAMRKQAVDAITAALQGQGEEFDRLSAASQRYNPSLVFSDEVKRAIREIGGEHKLTARAAEQATVAEEKRNDELERTSPIVRDATGAVIEFDEELDEIGPSGEAIAKAFQDIADSSKAFDLARERAELLMTSIQSPGDVFSDLMQAAEKEIDESNERRAQAENQSWEDRIEATQDALEEEKRAYQDSGEFLKNEMKPSVRALEDQLESLREEYSKNKVSAEDFKDSSQTAVVAVQTWATALRDAADKNDKWRANLGKLREMLSDPWGAMDAGRQEFLKTITDMGAEGQPLLEGLVSMTRTQVDEIVAQHARLAPEVGVSLREYMTSIREQITAGAEFEANLKLLMKNGFNDVAAFLSQQGEAGVQLVSEVANDIKNGNLEPIKELQEMLPDHARYAGEKASKALYYTLEQEDLVYKRIMAEKGRIGREALEDEFKRVSAEEMNQVIKAADAELARLGPVTLPLRLSAGYDANTIATAGGTAGMPAIDIGNGTFLVVGGSGVRMQAQGGIDAPHTAQIAPAGAWRVWAEPETGGEAYIPLAKSKRERSVGIWEETGRRLGIEFAQFADGGWLGTRGSHRDWNAEGLGGYIHRKVQEAMSKGLDLTIVPLIPQGQVDTEPTGSQTVTGPDEKGQTYQSIVAYMKSSGVPHKVVSTVRPGAITATGKPSYHGKGRAVDFGGAGPYGRRDTPELLAVNRAFLPIASQLKELIYSGPGAVEYWNGRPHNYTGITADNHHDHVHVAMKYGGILKALRDGSVFNGYRSYDSGGMLAPGWTMSYNGTGKPEQVVNKGGGLERTLARIEAVLNRSPGKTVNLDNHFYERADPVKVGAEIVWRI